MDGHAYHKEQEMNDFNRSVYEPIKEEVNGALDSARGAELLRARRSDYDCFIRRSNVASLLFACFLSVI